ITHVYGSGQMTFLKLVADGMDPIKANDAVNKFSDFFGNKYLSNDAHAQTPFIKRLQLAPGHSVSQMPEIVKRGFANTLRARPADNNFLGTLRDNATGLAGGMASYSAQDLMGLHKVQQQILDQNKKDQ